jgi:citrate synthase
VDATGRTETSRLTAAQAAARLGVKRETIYAYVSRGLLTSIRALDGKTSTFDPAELDRMRRRRQRGHPGRLEVSVTSAITDLADGRVAYRGNDLGELVAAGRSFEEVAEMLWTGQIGDGDDAGWYTPRSVATVVRRAARALPIHATPTDRMMAGVVAAGAADPFRDDRSVGGVTSTARVLIRAIVDSLPPRAEPAADSIAASLWSRLTDAAPGEWPLLDATMVALADHGMATSTLAARLAASTRAGPHAVILAGLGAVAGPLHGGASRLVHRLLVDADDRGADAAIADVLRLDGKIPGIGHFIHRQADPRYEIIAPLVLGSQLDRARLDVVADLSRRTLDRVPVNPNVDFALGALTFAAGMDEDAGEVVFAMARTAGWVAHALEEYREAPLRFRPVGRYAGPFNPGISPADDRPRPTG